MIFSFHLYRFILFVSFESMPALISPLNMGLKSKNFIFRNFFKNDPIRGNFMWETRWRIIFVKTLPFFRKSNFCIFRNMYFHVRKFDFLKNGARFYAKITSPTCFPQKITHNRVIFEKISKIFSILDHVQWV